MKIKSRLVFFILISLMFVTISQLSSALEPKLLWKKEIPSELFGLSFARKSGDVIFIHEYKGNRNRITILNMDGQIVWQWGPSLEESISSVEISEDGRVFVFSSSKDMIYYYQRDGKELWKLNNHKDPTLSPDGKYVILSPPIGWKGEGLFLDSQGKIIWKSPKLAFTEAPVFSPDGNYFAEMPYIFDISGNTWPIPSGYYNSLSENGTYAGIEGRGKEEDGIYDKDGNLVFGGKNLISGNGKIVARFGATKTEVFKFPEKIKLKEYPIERADIEEGYWAFGHESYSRISYDGRYLAVFGRRTDKESLENVFVIDIGESRFWGGVIPEVGRKLDVGLFLTDDGQYLLVGNVKNHTTFYFYKIY
jgi:WD40 repeat protein